MSDNLQILGKSVQNHFPLQEKLNKMNCSQISKQQSSYLLKQHFVIN